MINTAHHIDCLEGMKKIPDKSIDMILCDLPYSITQNSWDAIIPFEPLWKHYERIIKDNGAIVLTASQPFTSALVMSNPKLFKYEWIWQKNIATGHLNAGKMPMKKHENILVFYANTPVYNPQKSIGTAYINKRKPINDNGSNYGYIERKDTINDGFRLPTSVLNFDREIGLAPTQKPVALFEYLIKTYTNKGETVLDNCAGSFTTGIACLNTNRNYILMEKEEKYFKIGSERLEKHKEKLLQEPKTLFQSC